MSFESELYSLLGTQAVTAIVGDRIVPVHGKDQEAAPYIVYGRIFTEPRNSLDGNVSGANRVRTQVDCYSEDFDQAIAMAAAVRAAIPNSGSTLHGICINEFDFGMEEGTRLFRRVVEFSLFHKPPDS